MAEIRNCSARVYDSSIRTSFMCSKAAKVERDGHWYCTIHDPVRRRAAQEKSNAAHNARMEANRRASALEEAMSMLGKEVFAAYHDDSTTIAEFGDVVANLCEATKAAIAPPPEAP